MQKLSPRPRSIPKLVLEAVYQIARNEQSRYYRYRARGLTARPKDPPSQRPVIRHENRS